jgi:heat shock protein HtpX
MWSGFGIRGGRGRGNNPIALVFLVAALVWAASFFLLRALSRYREYAADRGSMLLTGTPAALRSALIKTSDAAQHIPSRDLRSMQTASAFFIVSPTRPSRLGELFDAHPILEHRLARLEAMERTMNMVPR